MALKDRRLVEIRMRIEEVDRRKKAVRDHRAEAGTLAKAVVDARRAYWEAIRQAKEDGATFDEIGSVLGVTKQRAQSLYLKALEAKG